MVDAKGPKVKRDAPEKGVRHSSSGRCLKKEVDGDPVSHVVE